MTTEERLSSAERHIAELQDQTSTLAQGQTAHDAILDRMGELLERLHSSMWKPAIAWGE